MLWQLWPCPAVGVWTARAERPSPFCPLTAAAARHLPFLRGMRQRTVWPHASVTFHLIPFGSSFSSSIKLLKSLNQIPDYKGRHLQPLARPSPPLPRFFFLIISILVSLPHDHLLLPPIGRHLSMHFAAFHHQLGDLPPALPIRSLKVLSSPTSSSYTCPPHPHPHPPLRNAFTCKVLKHPVNKLTDFKIPYFPH